MLDIRNLLMMWIGLRKEILPMILKNLLRLLDSDLHSQELLSRKPSSDRTKFSEEKLLKFVMKTTGLTSTSCISK